MSEELKYPHERFELLKSEIPQPFRFEIEDNLDKEFYQDVKCTKYNFISNAFDWDETSHGVKYWCEVEEPFCNGSLQQLADQVNKERWDTLKVGDTLYSITEDGREGIVTEKYRAVAVLKVGKKDNYIGYENWFNHWTPIKPKHWKEDKPEMTESELKQVIRDTGPIVCWPSPLTEENAINLLKEKGYKILRPTTNYEEI